MFTIKMKLVISTILILIYSHRYQTLFSLNARFVIYPKIMRYVKQCCGTAATCFNGNVVSASFAREIRKENVEGGRAERGGRM